MTNVSAPCPPVRMSFFPAKRISCPAPPFRKSAASSASMPSIQSFPSPPKGCPRQALRSAYPVHILRSGHRHLYRPKADHCLDRHKACRRHNLRKAYPVLFLRRHRRHRRPQLEDHRQDHLSEYRCPHLHEAYLCQSCQNLSSAFTTVQDVITPDPFS